MNRQSVPAAQLPLDLKLEPGATFESYYPGSNAGVVEELRSSLDPCNWLYLWGGESSGKTHLLNAACHAAGERGQAACLLPLSRSDGFDPGLLENLHGLALICVDDVQAIAGSRVWEEALFHMLNHARRDGAGVILSADSGAAGLDLALPDLRSRLGWGTVLKLRPLDDEEKVQALQLRARSRGLDLPRESAWYLMRRVARDTRTLMALLEHLDTASLQAKRKLTVPFLRESLKGFSP